MSFQTSSHSYFMNSKTWQIKLGVDYLNNNINKKVNEPVTTYQEKMIGKTLYRVTSVYKGEFELGKALEDLTIRKILREENNIEINECKVT